MMVRIARVILLMIVVAWMLSGCSEKPKTEQQLEKSIPVKMAPVLTENLAVPIITSGRLFPQATMKLSFKTGGIIKRIYVKKGNLVKQGEKLADLDLAEIKARFKQAENGFIKAERDLKRLTNLFNDKAATLEQLENVKTAFHIAESALTIAKFNLLHSTIVAPSAGRILTILVEENEMIAPGYPVLVFGSSIDQWVVKCGISEKNIIRIGLGDKAEVRFDAYPQQSFQATVAEVSESLDPGTGTYEVELQMEVNHTKLVSGFIARIKITPAAVEPYQVIPIEALVKGEGDRGAVFTAENERARKISIRLAFLFDRQVAVRSGLENVKSVVTDGATYLTDGVKVKVIQ